MSRAVSRSTMLSSSGNVKLRWTANNSFTAARKGMEGVGWDRGGAGEGKGGSGVGQGWDRMG